MMFSKQLRMLRFWEPQRPWKEILEHFNGISVKNYSLKRDEKEFLTFLIILGGPPSSTILTSILTREHKVQVVVVEELSSTDVLTLYKLIHFPQTNQKFFDVPLYCKAVRNMTPKEAETPINDNKDDEITEVVKTLLTSAQALDAVVSCTII